MLYIIGSLICEPFTGLRSAQVGPFLVTQALYPLLKKRETRTIVNVSSGLGSITLARAGHFPLAGTIPSYTSSKAALNMRAPQSPVSFHVLGVFPRQD